jgi:hypothetical protein
VSKPKAPLTRKRPRVPAGRRGRPSATKQDKGKYCIVPECGRDFYARGLCQTHHRQLLTTGKVGTIRPYRQRSDGTVKFAGLRLSPHCAEMVRAHADRTGLSHGATIAKILEGWHARKKARAPDGDT